MGVLYGTLTVFCIFYYYRVNFFLTGIICNCRPHGYASFDEKKKKKKIKSARRFVADKLAWGPGSPI